MIATAEILILALVAGLVVFGLGLAFFILGIILRNPKQWIPGAVLGVVGIMLVAGGFIAGLWGLVSRISSTTDHYDRYNYNYEYDYNSGNGQNETDQEIPSEIIDTSASQWDTPVNGMIQDADKSVIFIRVFPERALAVQGIHLVKIDRSNAPVNKKAIKASLTFDAEFRGWLQLDLYDRSDAYLGSSMLEVSRSGNGEMTVQFVYEKQVSFSDVDYARLRIAAN